MQSSRADCGPYTIILDSVPREGVSRVVVQVPDGLKPYSHCIADAVSSWTGSREVYIHGDSVFGACDLQYPQLSATIDPDLIVHVGHTPYPASLASPSVEPRGRPRIAYAPALSRLKPSDSTVREAARILKARGARRVAVVATSQHVHIAGWAARLLSREGLEARVPPGIRPFFEDGQVIGCDYRVALGDWDAYASISGGVFHSLGLYLAAKKPVVKIDPYRDAAVDITVEGERVLRVRLYKVSQAMGASRWGIVVGVKTGQHRPWLVGALRRAIQEKGGEYRLLAFEYLNEQLLRNIDNEWYQAFVVTSCPRIPIDDLQGYEKPVLTPGEAFMALTGRLEPYRFPW